jgi:MFS superfamily sulfate permease-like transporter
VHAENVAADTRSTPGLVVYRFTGPLYYANANHFLEDVTTFVKGAGESTLGWFCLDAAAIPDIDYSGGETLRQAHDQLAEVGARLVFAELLPDVRSSLERYGILGVVGDDAVFERVSDVLDAHASSAGAPPAVALVSPGLGDDVNPPLGHHQGQWNHRGSRRVGPVPAPDEPIDRQ